MKTERIDISKVNPNAYQPLFDLYNNCKKSTLTDQEFLLIEIRASQINGCAYCIQMHIKEAIEKGEKQYRIHALSIWKDSPFFTKEEQIILAMTEEITNISDYGLSENVYQKAIETFGERKVADIIMAICGINSWNRIGIATLLVPAPSQE
ncbi:carboxymuconolactone decarboxylase family protein [Aquimarina sp. BL5]|uniref:carboxymuconolactone decarboxylase family protein n=1 Tax=Aquimarina sp. BL5 TaxID=1714860 RepID=UPI000E52D67F|nr:carboxymuconolactone decarboxylase family protein [Aquimarina sp. BL5]AXT52884.1 carboxymuconolactone decarboxylase family protein [Aquimarina sp. BL5]RKN07493.1 carboxymuconolactone decarboxylase family protein [Aquimarina sp. BL5]